MNRLLILSLILIMGLVSVYANPILQPIAPITVNETEQVIITLTCSQPDNGSTSFSKNVTFGILQQGSNISASFVWTTPSVNMDTTYAILFTVSDDNSSNSTVAIINVKNIIVNASMTATDATFGSDKQRRSNPNAEDEEDRIVRLRTTITLENTGSASITNLRVSSINVPAKYNLTVKEFSSTSLPNIGSKATVTLEATIPEDFDAVDNNLKKTPFDIGSITFEGDSVVGTVTATSKLKMEAKNYLEIKRVIVKVKDKTTKTFGHDDVTIKNIKPGDSIEVTIVVENKYDGKDPEDIDIEDIETRLIIDGLDIDESEDISAINPDETEEVTIIFDVDEDADDDKYEMYIEIEGIDENGAKHGEKWSFVFEVRRMPHEIGITDVYVPSISCEDIYIPLTVTIKNIGRDKREDEVSIKVSSEDLNYNKRIYDIELEENDELTEIFNIPIPKGVEGEKTIKIETFYKRTVLSNSKLIKVVLPSCTQAKEIVEEPKKEEKTEVIIQPPENVTEFGPILPITETVEPIFPFNLYIISLMVGIGIALISLIFMIIVLVKLRKK